MKKLALATATSLLFSLNASAALYDRGNGMIYDSEQNITWLQDFNYAQTSGYDSDGRMSWEQAQVWANGFQLNGISGWRLPSAKIIGGSDFSFDGSTDYSYNNARSELGHLYFELGNKSRYDRDGNLQVDFGVAHTSIDPVCGLFFFCTRFESFFQVQYWEKEEVSFSNTGAWAFDAFQGAQSAAYFKFSDLSVVLVRDGDVAAVPVPASTWLFGSGLIGLLVTARKRKTN